MKGKKFMEDKNYSNVEVLSINGSDSVALRIEIKIMACRDWNECYQKALIDMGGYTSWRSSGAPTIDKVTFNGHYAQTMPFPNNQHALNDAKVFLSEFNNVLGLAYKNWYSLIEQKENELKQKQKEQEEKDKEIERLNKFFNE